MQNQGPGATPTESSECAGAPGQMERCSSHNGDVSLLSRCMRCWGSSNGRLRRRRSLSPRVACRTDNHRRAGCHRRRHLLLCCPGVGIGTSPLGETMSRSAWTLFHAHVPETPENATTASSSPARHESFAAIARRLSGCRDSFAVPETRRISGVPSNMKIAFMSNKMTSVHLLLT